MKYHVEVEFKSTGYFVVEADNIEQAKEIVNNQCSTLMKIDEKSNALDWDYEHLLEKCIKSVKIVK